MSLMMMMMMMMMIMMMITMMMMMMNCFVVWLNGERRVALILAGTIARDPHHRESPTRRDYSAV